MQLRRLLTLGVACTLSGCGAPAPSAEPGFSVADSAGIRIVESTTPSWGEGEAWRIADEPEVVIGAVDGDERYLLSRVYSVRRFSDGRIAVLDGGSSRVRIYDPQGRHLQDIGGPGDGPAEFSFAQHLRLLGDTIVVYDASPPALAWFTDDGTLLRTVPLVPRATGQPLVSAYSFGFLTGSDGVLASSPRDRPWLQPGLQREEMTLWRYDLHEGLMDSIARVRRDEITVRVSESGRMAWNTLTFGKTTYFAASNDRVFLAPTEHYSITVLDRAGVPQSIMRRRVTPRPATQEHLARALRQLLQDAGMTAEQIETRVDAVGDQPIAETMPAHHIIIADANDNLWVEDFDDVGVNQGAFSVFDADGVWLGRVELPPGLSRFRSRPVMFAQMEIGSDYILGVWTAEFGVEQVRMYRIEKN